MQQKKRPVCGGQQIERLKVQQKACWGQNACGREEISKLRPSMKAKEHKPKE